MVKGGSWGAGAWGWGVGVWGGVHVRGEEGCAGTLGVQGRWVVFVARADVAIDAASQTLTHTTEEGGILTRFLLSQDRRAGGEGRVEGVGCTGALREGAVVPHVRVKQSCLSDE